MPVSTNAGTVAMVGRYGIKPSVKLAKSPLICSERFTTAKENAGVPAGTSMRGLTLKISAINGLVHSVAQREKGCMCH